MLKCFKCTPRHGVQLTSCLSVWYCTEIHLQLQVPHGAMTQTWLPTTIATWSLIAYYRYDRSDAGDLALSAVHTKRLPAHWIGYYSSTAACRDAIWSPIGNICGQALWNAATDDVGYVDRLKAVAWSSCLSCWVSWPHSRVYLALSKFYRRWSLLNFL
ncbi:hypothetical protein BDV96DRAFT_584746 [Lophiotrema nucula]|uniref:Uncharacterized protein n=1 Tax=Lophiotrema nucula TaxID=690887 RepID=A0A6A5YS23_9PLEO|nr:hypothetical protein BDV96DRAFT_584746 [Lophiotrema nucula]